MHSDTNEISKIKAQLKRQSWLLRLSVLAWVGGLALYMFNGATKTDTIENLRVKRLTIIDANGEERMALFANENSTPTTKDVLLRGKLGFVDSNSKERLLLDMDSDYAFIGGKDWPRQENFSGLVFKDLNGEETGGMGTDQTGGIALSFDSKINPFPPPYEWLKKSDRLHIYANQDGKVGIDFKDLNSQDERMSIVSDPANGVGFTLHAPNSTSGIGTVKLSGYVDSNGNATWIAPNN